MPERDILSGCRRSQTSPHHVVRLHKPPNVSVSLPSLSSVLNPRTNIATPCGPVAQAPRIPTSVSLPYPASVLNPLPRLGSQPAYTVLEVGEAGGRGVLGRRRHRFGELAEQHRQLVVVPVQRELCRAPDATCRPVSGLWVRAALPRSSGPGTWMPSGWERTSKCRPARSAS